jgi:Spy/CpxP family protein refolding chaperone
MIVIEGRTYSMKLFTKISVGVLLAALAVSPVVAQFGGWAGGRFHKDPTAMIDHFGRVLDLTDAQKQAAKTLFSDAKAQAEPIASQLKQGHELMAAAVKGNRSDTEIIDIAARQGVLVGQLAAIHAKAMARFYAQLTPEQKTKADAIHDHMKSRFMGRFGAAQ